MRLVLAFAILALVVSAAAVADDTPAAKLEAIKRQHKDAEASFRKAAGELPDTPEGQKKYDELYKAYDQGQADRFQAAVDLAKADPKSAFALDALEWVLTIPRAYYLPAGPVAMDLAAEHHAANPKVGKIIAWVGYFPPHPLQNEKAAAAAAALIKAVAEKNPDRTARGQAHLGIALAAFKKFSEAEFKKAADADKLATAAEAAYEALIKDYGDCRRLTREDANTIGEFAGAGLFELRNLRVGKTAPEIEGEDIDGVKFKLSDYRGKVVMLDFWGHW